MPFISKVELAELRRKYELTASIKRIEERLIMMEHAHAAVVAAASGVAVEVNRLSEVMEIAGTMEKMVKLLARMERERNTVRVGIHPDALKFHGEKPAAKAKK